MAQFRATIRGQRGEASRLGSKTSGIVGHVCGWDSGVRVSGEATTNGDCFDVFMTGGSNGRTGVVYLGRVVVVDGTPTWRPAGEGS